MGHNQIKLLYDHQAFYLQRYGGISRYFTSLIGALIADNLAIVQMPFRWVQNVHLMQSSYANVRDPFSGMDFRGKARILDVRNKFLLQRALRLKEFDVFQPTHYDDYFLPHLGPKPFVITIHDLIAQRLPRYFSQSDRYESNKKRLTEHAARIIAVSESTRKDLIALFGTSPERVTTIPLAAAPLRPSEGFPFAVPDRYLLYVGQRSAYKNFNRFSEAMAIVLASDPDLHLFCAGGGPLKDSETQAIRNFVQGGRVHWRSVDDAVLAALYRDAEAFVFPSLYEGFGIPILESLQMGCPAIVSDRSSFPEVAGDAALYFDPDDVASIADTIQRVIGDKALKTRLRDAGFRRERDFSWQATARKTLMLYQELR